MKASAKEPRGYQPCPLGPGYHDLNSLDDPGPVKRWIGKGLSEGWLKVKNLVNRFKIASRTLYDYKRKYVNNEAMHKSSGKPKALLQSDLEEIKAEMNESKYLTKTTKAIEIINKVAKQRSVINGKCEYRYQPLHHKTIERTISQINAKKKKAEVTTEARAVALADKRNMITFAAINKALVPLTVPELILNWDATQYGVGDGKDGKVDVVVAFHLPYTLSTSP